jgi:hypothetical protein
MRNSGVINATINKLGVSSFAGAMEINNALDVDGTVKIVHNGSERITMTPGSTETTSIVSVFGDLKLGSSVNERVSILHGGTGSFQGKVTAGQFSTGTEAYIDADGNASFAGTMQVASTLTVGSTSSFASGMQVGGTSGTTCLTTGGDVEGTDFIIPSDRRFKTEITHIPNALDKIKQISGCTYKVGDKPSAGVIAQEILKVLPEVVHTREDGYYAVSYHGLIGLLIEAVKELSEKVK